MRFLMSGLISCVAVLTASGGDDDAVKADLKKFQGKWKVVSAVFEGKPVKAQGTWTIKGNKVLVGGGWYNTITLHPDAKPKAYDFDQLDAGGEVREKGMKAIYAFDGE